MAKLLINRQGEKEDFDERKLYASIYHPAREAGYDDREAEELAEQVCEEIVEWATEKQEGVVTAMELRSQTIDMLAQHDEDVAFMYETYLDLS